MNTQPNPCTTPACREADARPRPIVETDHVGVGMVRCPSCDKVECGNDRDHAISEWNAFNPRPFPWRIIIAALAIAGALAALFLLI